jgi:uncharacterized protein
LISRELDLMISLDGLGVYHDIQRPLANGQGSFVQIMRNVECALSKGLLPQISITVTGASIEGLPRLVSWLLDQEIPFSVNLYRENDLSASFETLRLDERRIIDGMMATFAVIEANLPKHPLLNALVDKANFSRRHERTCAVGNGYLVISHKGDVAKCQMEIAKPVTSIRETDPLSLVRADKMGIQNLPVDEKEGCQDCQWRYWCAGGCPFAAHRATGRYDVKSPNCNIYKAIFPAVLRLEQLRLAKSSLNNVVAREQR